MRKIDHVRKTVYIIVGCLTIVSLVLTICHKVGHCASSTYFINSSDLPPLPYSNGFGSPSADDVPLTTMYNDFVGRDGRVRDRGFICYVYETNSDHTQVSQYVLIASYGQANVGISYPNQVGVGQTFNIGGNGFYCVYDANGSFISKGYSKTTTCTLTSDFISADLQNGGWSFNLNYYLTGYPIYISSDVNVSGTDNWVEFEPLPDFSGHSKGGVLDNYIDSDDLIEQDSSLPNVDITPPADPSSNSGWFQKILNGLSKINQSIKGGVLTIGDYLGQIYYWLTEPFDQEQFSSDLNQIALINDFSNLKTQVENCGIFDWSDVSPAQTVSFTFDFGGSVLPHTQTVVDFSWYNGTVKNICVAVICTFLVLGLLVTIINQLPNIIGGKSGDKGGGSDS